MLKFFSSVKLTLGLLLLLAVISIGGTIVPVEAQRYEPYFQAPWFRVLLGLLAVNLICCTLKTFPGKWNYRRHLLDTLGNQRDGESIAIDSLSVVEERLAASGYRVEGCAEGVLAERGSLGRWGATLVHVAILLIMLGGVLGETGFVGTINTYLEHPNHFYFDWDVEQERELGFVFRADDFQLRYYPIQLRFELFDTVRDVDLGEMIVYDNETFQVPGTPLVAQLRGFEPQEKVLTIDVLQDGKLLGQYLIGEKLEHFGAAQHPAFRLRNLQYRDPVLKQMEADVSILEAGQLVKQGTIRVNDPLTYRGVSIYQTAYGQDEFGNRSVGFQLSKDPGEWLVWPATLLLMLGFAIAFLLPRRALGVKEVAGQLVLCPLRGWQGTAGQQQLDALLKHLNR